MEHQTKQFLEAYLRKVAKEDHNEKVASFYVSNRVFVHASFEQHIERILKGMFDLSRTEIISLVLGVFQKIAQELPELKQSNDRGDVHFYFPAEYLSQLRSLLEQKLRLECGLPAKPLI